VVKPSTYLYLAEFHIECGPPNPTCDNKYIPASLTSSTMTRSSVHRGSGISQSKHFT
jgi:hypothetical protein